MFKKKNSKKNNSKSVSFVNIEANKILTSRFEQ